MGKCKKRTSGWPRTTMLIVRIVLISAATGGANIALPVAWCAEPSSAARPQLHRDAQSSKGSRSRGNNAAGGADCNGNGIPDDVEIETCAGSPACDDCNLNGVPDECDVSAGTSIDSDLDGVPDECFFFDDGGPDDNWGTPENWDTDEVPNNLDLIDDENATVEMFDVNLDLKVEVDTLRLLDGASMTITGLVDEDLFVEEPGGLLLASVTAQQSRLMLGARQIMMATSLLDVQSGGLFDLAPTPAPGANGEVADTVAGVLTPLLVVGNVRVSSKCGEPVPGELNLRGSTEANVYGDFVVDASQDCVVCAFCGLSGGSNVASIAGGETPPIVRVIDNAKLRIGGALFLSGGVQFVQTSSSAIEVSGNFVNNSTCPECFDLSGGIVFQPQGFAATSAVVANPMQFIEVAGRDRGASPSGFDTNFALGRVEVASSTLITFVDNFSNTDGAGTEAVYVDTLVVRSGATVTVSDCRIYYNNLINEGAAFEFTGRGALLRVVAQAPIPAASTWGLLLLAAGLGVAGTVIVSRSGRTCSSRAS